MKSYVNLSFSTPKCVSYVRGLGRTVIFLGFLLVLGACTWVKPTDNSSAVSVVQDTHVSSCKPLGKTLSSVKDRLGVLKRREHKVAEELIVLAKNAAVSMGGDTLVVDSAVTNGTQGFRVYQCKE